ncbi:MAG: hypothetical protein B7Y76_10130, partial [Sphingobacteriia bacterium 35-40-5]
FSGICFKFAFDPLNNRCHKDTSDFTIGDFNAADVGNAIKSLFNRFSGDISRKEQKIIKSVRRRLNISKNHFGVSSNQRAVPLWSAGLKWDLASEEFYKLDLPKILIKWPQYPL